MTLTPAYGRDYRSKAAVLADWKADKDFLIADVMSAWDGKPVNRPQLESERSITVRYGKLRKVMVIR